MTFEFELESVNATLMGNNSKQETWVAMEQVDSIVEGTID
jgi:hypothetical protein